ncbi:4597_t:CDS:2, partial [Acaulospora morrowiae]
RAALTTITINKADGDITGSEPEKIFNNKDKAIQLKKRREAAVQRKQNQTPEDAARFWQSKRQRYMHIVDTSIIESLNAISPIDSFFITAIPATILHIISLPIALQLFQSGDLEQHQIGRMDRVCKNCDAIIWSEEKKTNFSRTLPIFTNCCIQGKVLLPALLDPPPILHALLTSIDTKARNFRRKIRSYNLALAFTSIGAKIIDCVTGAGGVYMFQIHGEMYHNIGSLLPAQATASPRFAQLYIYDTEHEVLNRITMMPSLDATVLADLQQMLDQVNPYVVVFQQVRDILIQELTITLSMVIRAERLADSQCYNIPTANEVAAIIENEQDTEFSYHDIILSLRDEHLQ